MFRVSRLAVRGALCALAIVPLAAQASDFSGLAYALLFISGSLIVGGGFALRALTKNAPYLVRAIAWGAFIGMLLTPSQIHGGHGRSDGVVMLNLVQGLIIASTGGDAIYAKIAALQAAAMSPLYSVIGAVVVDRRLFAASVRRLGAAPWGMILLLLALPVLWWSAGRHTYLQQVMQSFSEGRQLRVVRVETVDRIGRAADGDLLVCATVRGAKGDPPRPAQIRLPGDYIEPLKTRLDQHISVIEEQGLDGAQAVSDGCDLDAAGSFDATVFTGWKTQDLGSVQFNPSADALRELRAHAGLEATVYWRPGTATLIYTAARPLRTVDVSDKVAGVWQRATIEEHYVLFQIDSWAVEPQPGALGGELVDALCKDFLYGPLEWAMYYGDSRW